MGAELGSKLGSAEGILDRTTEGRRVGICVLNPSHGTPVPKPHAVVIADGSRER